MFSNELRFPANKQTSCNEVNTQINVCHTQIKEAAAITAALMEDERTEETLTVVCLQ